MSNNDGFLYSSDPDKVSVKSFLDTIVLVVMHAKYLCTGFFQLDELTCKEANLERRMDTTYSAHPAEELEQIILIVF